MEGYALSIGMDTAQRRGDDSIEHTGAAGGGAYLVGPEDESLAVFQGSYSFVTDAPDFWRRAEVKYPSHGDRFTGEPAYFKHTMTAAQTLMHMLDTKPSEYTYAVFHQPNVKFPERAAKQLGFSEAQIKYGLLAGGIG